MSLTDLKKGSGDKPNKKKFTVDEFISDAENYAQGAPEIVSSNVAQAVSAAKQRKDKKHQQSTEHKPFRHSTFTLSEEAIDQLQMIAKETNLAKSHIIRILIDELCNKDRNNQIEKLIKSKVQ